MTLAWSAYAARAGAAVPGAPWTDLAALGGAFAAVVRGRRRGRARPGRRRRPRGALVVLLTPVFGVASATALALIARVVHTVADATDGGRLVGVD